MSVNDLIKRLKVLDPHRMIIISDGEGWCNIDKLDTEEDTIKIMVEKFPLFSDN